MNIALLISGVAFAAFCMWLTVRVVNRRERWAKWTLAGVVGLPLLYVASFGPACWLCEHGILGQKAAWIAYRPLTWIASAGPMRAGIQERMWIRAGVSIRAYATAFGDKRRIESRFERDGKLTSYYERAICQNESVSPIDYEIEQSQTIDLIGMILDVRHLRRQSQNAIKTNQ